jgi:hypothetical protein
MHSTYLCKAYFAVFNLGATIVNFTLTLEMPGAFALATLVFQMWRVFAPVKVPQQKHGDGGTFCAVGLVEIVGAYGIADILAEASVWHSAGRFL